LSGHADKFAIPADAEELAERRRAPAERARFRGFGELQHVIQVGIRQLPDLSCGIGQPFLNSGEDRRPTLSWPRQLPIEGEPADVVRIVEQWSGRGRRTSASTSADSSTPGPVTPCGDRPVVADTDRKTYGPPVVILVTSGIA
jgi:haloalkane dehalogenase